MNAFNADETFVLNPGDILYIPPEVAHYGIASTEDCVTCSIGIRMPSHSELLTSFVDQLAQNLSDNDRFEEPLFVKQPNTGEITDSDINNIKSILINQLDINKTPMIDWFGKYISEYRSIFYEFNQVQDKKLFEIYQKDEQFSLIPSPYSKSCYFSQNQGAVLFINGEKYDATIKLAELICNDGLISSSEILKSNDKDQQIIEALFASGALIPK
jgi:50S ribosomal protein L16 3-hydroxylase